MTERKQKYFTSCVGILFTSSQDKNWVVWTSHWIVNYHEIHNNPMKLASNERKNMVMGLEGLVGKNA
jgi:hypothetical protein